MMPSSMVLPSSSGMAQLVPSTTNVSRKIQKKFLRYLRIIPVTTPAIPPRLSSPSRSGLIFRKSGFGDITTATPLPATSHFSASFSSGRHTLP